MTIFHNDRIKITPTSQRPSVTPQHCAVTPPDYTHKQTHSPTSEEQPFIALNDEPSFVADYDRLVNYIMITLLVAANKFVNTV